ncbi:MAG TPA: ATP-dependent protease ATPase subunit HslU [Thermomicrobiales bacterium]|nr:ATP-dependent protease ATPase subunit HslU [Thermomicrobiales bacterium]
MAESRPQPAATKDALRTSGEGPSASPATTLENLTPVQIVAELDRYVIGQTDAKRAVAVALRNRYRRQLLPEGIRDEVQPKNILMMGPTGVGKTEIARRVAKLINAPFIKVEATKFTEVGYVGRDVESIVRDLVEVAITNVHDQRLEQVRDEATKAAVQRLADILTSQNLEKKDGKGKASRSKNGASADGSKSDDAAEEQDADPQAERRRKRERTRLLRLLDQQAIEEETVEIEMEDDGYEESNPLDVFNSMSQDDIQDTFADFLDGFLPRRPMRRKVSVREARRILTQQEANRLVDFDSVIESAIRRVEDAAVVFIDEIDKVISNDEYGGEVSGEGVQRDLLPIVEGSVVMTRYGPVRTDHVLFIAAGAFHGSRPSDLIPELQGRFPIRVELKSLSEDDLYRILTEPDNALTKQYVALIGTEGLTIDFAEEGLREMARMATQVNASAEDIGARRLHTIMEKVLEELSFDAPARSGETVEINRPFVEGRIGPIALDEDLSDFIL